MKVTKRKIKAATWEDIDRGFESLFRAIEIFGKEHHRKLQAVSLGCSVVARMKNAKTVKTQTLDKQHEFQQMVKLSRS